MTLASRRRFAAALAAAALGAAAPALAADPWPSRPLTLIVNGGPGSLPDSFARPLADKLRVALGQPVVVDNKPGAGGMVALQTLRQSPPDGHTLAIVTNAHVVWNPFVFPKLSYDPQADLLPVSPVAVIPMALAVHPRLPAQNVAELVQLAKQQPGKLNYASSSTGSPPHVLFELFKAQSGADIVHVPFKTGTDALTSVVGGDTQMYLAGTSLVEPMVRDGRLRVLAVSPSVKSPVFAGAPTLESLGHKGFESAVWLGVVANAGVPPAVVERLNREIGAALGDAALAKAFESHGSLPWHASPAAFAERIAADRALWTPILQKLNLAAN
ncbi:MAG: tripartite tricarboxylate transporter substrate binding protein [Ottowia sp.]|uniref:Bug family tripartite tricarboxylate transporter substrate binding protein n=1 Tax=Ottowia sp. TaxID=1898956 RepID=UPI0039E42C2C